MFMKNATPEIIFFENLIDLIDSILNIKNYDEEKVLEFKEIVLIGIKDGKLNKKEIESKLDIDIKTFLDEIESCYSIPSLGSLDDLNESLNNLDVIKNKNYNKIKEIKEIIKNKLGNNNSNQILSIDESETIFHYSKGELMLKRKSIPKYYKILGLIIKKFPVGKNEILIKDFNKLLSDNERKLIGTKNHLIYKEHLSSAGRSLEKFFFNNGIENLNKKENKKIINASDNYIEFNNFL